MPIAHLIALMGLLAGTAAVAADPAAQSARKRHDPGQYFAKLDADKSGGISREEAKGHQRLEQGFDALDAIKDGQVSQEEFRGYLKGKHEKGAGKEKLKQHWEQADADKDGQLSRTEAEQSMPQIAKHFEQLDANGDNKLSPDELKKLRKPRGEQKPAKPL